MTTAQLKALLMAQVASGILANASLSHGELVLGAIVEDAEKVAADILRRCGVNGLLP